MSMSWRRTRKRIKNWLIYLLVKNGIKWILSIQRDTAITFLKNLSLLGFYLVRSERKKTIKHLTQVYQNSKTPKKINRMGKEVFLNLGRNMADAFGLARLNNKNIDRYIEIQGCEILDAALKKGKGVIVLTGHIGNWELLASYFAMKGYPVNVVGAPIYDPRLDELVVKNRVGGGLKYMERGSATREILKALSRNEIVGLLIDQDTKHVDGVFVDFLGAKAYTPVGPVLLAIKTGAAIVPMAIHIRTNDNHVIEVENELVLESFEDQEQNRIYNTQLCSNAVEKFIRKYPTQWVWMHERWKTRPGNVPHRVAR